MFKQIRNNQRTLLIVVSAVVIVAFVWLYSTPDPAKLRANRVATVYGDPLTRAEAESRMRLFRLAYQLGLADYVSGMSAGAQSEEDAAQQYLWNSLVIEHTARELGIEPDDEMIAQRLQSLPAFQSGGRFDITRYTRFIEEALAPAGMTEQQLEEVVRDELKFQMVRNLVAATVAAAEPELQWAQRRFNTLNRAHVIRFPADEMAKGITVAEEELAKAFEQHKEQLKTPERRSVQYVLLNLSPEQQQLPQEQRIAALQELAHQAEAFTQAVLDPEKDFASVADEHDLEIRSTEPFARDNPPEVFQESPAAASAAFALTPEDPDSDAIRAGNGFLILHLDKIEEPRPMTFEEARPRLEQMLRRQKTAEKLIATAKEVAEKLRAELKAGADFESATAAAGVDTETLPEFRLLDPPREIEDWQSVAAAISELDPGEISPLTPTNSGGLLVFLEERKPPPEDAAKSGAARLHRRMLMQRQQIAFAEWLRVQRAKAGLRNL